MPRIFDNIAQSLLSALCDTLQVADRADSCVGYFNLRSFPLVPAPVKVAAQNAYRDVERGLIR